MMPACPNFRCMGGFDASAIASTMTLADAFLFDAPDGEIGPLIACAGVVLGAGDETRARFLVEAGARRVLIGDAALLDAQIVPRLAHEFGPERIGIHAAARRMAVGWSFETTSNADFKVVTPSICEPAWEILRADGQPTGTLAHWWLGRMAEHGASCVVLQVDIDDDADLNLCAGLVEQLGDRLWVGPLDDPAPRLNDWIAYGQARNIVLSPAAYARRDASSVAPIERAA